jgi:hypothetical protein
VEDLESLNVLGEGLKVQESDELIIQILSGIFGGSMLKQEKRKGK